MILKYNYIIAGSGGFYNVAYHDLKKMSNVAYYSSFIEGVNNPLKQFLCRLNFNIKLNRYIKTPFSKIVYPWLFSHHFDDNKPLCFIFFGNQFALINSSYLEYLRKRYPSIKLVLFMQDIVASLPYYNIENYKNRFDLVLSYDKGDSIKYGLLYYPTPYSKYFIKTSKNEDIDVFFCGAAKSRYKTILDVYSRLTSNGLKCKFFITGVPNKDRIEGIDLHYDQRISYIENLEYVQNSKCILEIMQENADGFTPRLWEAIMYDKHLLTNNSDIKSSDYWEPDGIHLLKECDKYTFLDKKIVYSDNLKDSFSPINLLLFIEKKL